MNSKEGLILLIHSHFGDEKSTREVNKNYYEIEGKLFDDLDRLEKLEKENQELKQKVNHFEKVIEDIKNMPDCDFKKTLIDIGFKHMFDNCKN